MKEILLKSALPSSSSSNFHDRIKKPSADRARMSTFHSQFVQYGKNAREWMRKCEMLLPHIQRYEIWKKKGYTSIYHYAAVLAGMAKNKVDNALWTMKKIEGKDEILKVVNEKGINAVRPIANIVTPENQSFWADKAMQMSVHTLEVYAKEYRKCEISKGEDSSLNQSKIDPSSKLDFCHVAKKVVGMELEMEVVTALEKLKGPGDWNTLMKEFLELRKEKLEAEKPEKVRVVAKNSPAPKPYHSRQAPAKIQKYILKRTNGQCAFPSCNKPHKLKHHTDRYALNQEHDPDTYFPLCLEHERLAHLGLVENEEKDPSNWKIRTEADTTSPKYEIDQKVQQYRTTKMKEYQEYSVLKR